jgi:hypothetical protein
MLTFDHLLQLDGTNMQNLTSNVISLKYGNMHYPYELDSDAVIEHEEGDKKQGGGADPLLYV